MIPERIGFRHRLPLFFFTFVLLVAAVALCKPLWDASRGDPRLAARMEQEARLRVLCLQVVQLDETLTHAARDAAAGAAGTERKYRAAESQLRSLMPRLRAFSSDAVPLAEREASSAALRALEGQALDQVLEGRPEAAAALLSGAEYESRRRAFSREMSRLTDPLWQASSARLAEGLQERRRSTVFTVTLVCSLLLAWLILHVTLRNWQRTLTQINRQLAQRSQELGELNRTLDQRVAERTAEIDRANREIQSNQVQLVHAEKMAALGQIAAGVAHEINNPVGFVMSNVNTLSSYAGVFKRLLAEYEKLAEAVQGAKADEAAAQVLRIREIQRKEDLPYILKDVDHLLSESVEGTQRIKEIVQGLKSFVRLDEAQAQEADINECLEGTLKMIRNELKYKCEVHKNLAPLPRIRCFPGQLNQVFLNLLLNAAQAIGGRGEIFLTTEVADGGIQVRVRDTGAGIAPEHLPNLFTPFFTTKPVGKGTGLGLSISYGIVQKHGGVIRAESVPGQGATFTVSLPLPRKDAA